MKTLLTLILCTFPLMAQAPTAKSAEKTPEYLPLNDKDSSNIWQLRAVAASIQAQLNASFTTQQKQMQDQINSTIQQIQTAMATATCPTKDDIAVDGEYKGKNALVCKPKSKDKDSK